MSDFLINVIFFPGQWLPIAVFFIISLKKSWREKAERDVGVQELCWHGILTLFGSLLFWIAMVGFICWLCLAL